MNIRLFYFDGCPSYRKALDNLKAALRLEAPQASHVEMVAVASGVDARAKRFIGSPTIRIDGVDVEGPEAEKQGYGLGCRVYTHESCMTGWPSVEQIRQALERARKNPEGELT